MIEAFKCPKCKKVVAKPIIKRGNVRYMPISMIHKHNGINYICQAIERFYVVGATVTIDKERYNAKT